jgi:uncharacterized membrane protein YhiD involved in acid resistance
MWDKILILIRNSFANIALTSEDILNLLISLLIAIIIGIVISQVYKLTHRGVNFETSFMTSLVMLAPIVAIVMFFIQGNLVLSLGLVGSLSIIRFRTPIKDTRDMVYLFWAIAVGLGSGTYNWGIVIISSIVVLITIVILYFIKYGSTKNHDYVLILNGDARPNREAIQKIIHEFTSQVKLRSLAIDQGQWEIVYELQFSKKAKPVDGLVEALNAIEKITNISLLAPQLALPA